MNTIDFTLKNYRCFSDENPTRFSLSKGFTAFVGPNNAGKSSLLKMLYELRLLWQDFRADSSRSYIDRYFIPNHKIIINELKGVFDYTEIFCDLNQRPTEITLEVENAVPENPENPWVKEARLINYRDPANVRSWSTQFSPTIQRQIPNQGSPHFSGGSLIWAIPGTGQFNIGNFSGILRAFNVLANSIYMGPGRNVISQGSGSNYDITVGGDFINVWNDWKTGNDKSKNRRIEEVTADIQRIFGLQQLDIATSPSAKTFQIRINNKPYKLPEMGAGIAQFIIVFATAAIKNPTYILIDEPETNLHPSLQIDFLTSLGAYASEGVVFSTHSLGLARATAEKIYSVLPSPKGSIVKRFEQTPNYAEFIGEMSFASFRELGFDELLLVEGVEDVKTIQQFLRFYGLDHKVVVLPLGGDQLACGLREAELAELKRITSQVFVIVDSERESEAGPPKKERLAFETVCKNLGFKYLITKRRAIENYLTQAALEEEKGSGVQALTHFQRLKDVAKPWSKSESWRIARRMSKRDLDGTDLGDFLASISKTKS